MFKLGAFLIITAASYVVWQVRQVKARRRLREIDEGHRCIACNRTDLERSGGLARCLACGHTVSLASLQAAVVSASEIATMTKPDDRRRSY